jgi:hypothetical protein
MVGVVADGRGRGQVVVVLALVVGLATGCETSARTEATDGGDDPPASVDGTGTTDSTVPVITGPQGDVLEDGRHFALVRTLAPGGAAAAGSMELDLAQWFDGDAADVAAAEDGVIAPGQQIENDYYIRNVSDRLRAMPVAGDAATRVVDWDNCCELVPSTVDALAARGFDGGREAFWLTVRGGAVVGLDEQFRP